MAKPYLRPDQKYKLTFKAKRAVKNAGAGVHEAMAKVAPRMQRAIKNITPVDTGALKRSVTVKAVTRTKNPRIEVTCRAYGLFVEKGTVYQDAQPFITPIVHGQRKNWERELAREARRAMARKAKKRSR